MQRDHPYYSTAIVLYIVYPIAGSYIYYYYLGLLLLLGPMPIVGPVVMLFTVFISSLLQG